MGPTPDDLPPLRDVVRAHGLIAQRALGQNFLFDLNLTRRIARSSGPLLDEAVVVEVGPGPGALTRALLIEGAGHVVAVERDERCLPALAEIGARWPGRLTVIHGDALALDAVAALAPFAGRLKPRVVANLPYNIGTALLTGWLTEGPWPPWFDSLTLMFQREVADRIVADQRDASNYGRLGVLCGWRAMGRILFDVPPSAFTPPPKVMSSVVHLVPNPEPEPCELKRLERVTQAAFGQRRKMLRQSLKGLGVDVAGLIAAAGLDPTQRAETVPVAGFVALARAFAAMDAR
jgi:16S rRNA (adenine1518-N6/adenine1519-N6)-dimethyltransferase